MFWDRIKEKYLRTVGLEKQIGPIHRTLILVFTPDGCRMTHAMATQVVQNPAGILFPGETTPGGGVMSLKLPCLTKLEAGKLTLAHKSSLSLNITQAPKR